MDVTEAMDREVIAERAEAVRFWLLGLPVSHRATSAIQRELGAIIANDPGGYMNGQRPLAGLSISEFVDELNRPNGGAVGRVKRVTESMLNELRAAISAGAGLYRRQVAPVPAMPAVVAEVPPAPADAPPAPRDAPAAPPARRRGRPKGSTKAAIAARSNATAAHAAAPPSDQQADEPRSAGQPAPAAPKRGRGRPRRVAAPAPADAPAHGGASAPIAPMSPALPQPSAAAHAATAELACDDPLLGQISRLWPSLHPHARRALVMYASSLWAEGGFEG